MSIPIDKLYHYIESVAREIYNDNILIYRFYPHGAKKLENLLPINDIKPFESNILPHIYCNDQEPLNYDFYAAEAKANMRPTKALLIKYNIPHRDRNFQRGGTIYDSAIVIHSEKRSPNVELYRQHTYIPVYYWSHAIIARDWFRYARYDKIKKSVTKTFLIYNRAWAGTREYRLKFVDLLITSNLVDSCATTLNAVEPDLSIHYSQHAYVNTKWKPVHTLENYLLPNPTTSCASADYEIADYNATEFEVVLETLFDDERLHLTEKILRPIALGQPFLLAATHGSLEYLKSYGFKTFSSVFDETYDTINNPSDRLEAVVNTMKEIALWCDQERIEKIAVANQIAEYNRAHFFSDNFINQVTDELRNNLKLGLDELEHTNTSALYIDIRKQLSKFSDGHELITTHDTRQHLVEILTKARKYYNKH